MGNHKEAIWNVLEIDTGEVHTFRVYSEAKAFWLHTKEAALDLANYLNMLEFWADRYLDKAKELINLKYK